MLVALRFLTIIPLGRDGEPPSAAALIAFPVVGLLVGLAWAVPVVLLGRFAVSTAVTAAAILIVDAVLTGGLHLDATADVADGVASRRSGDEAVAIMREASVGALGAATLALAILLRYSLLLSLAGLPGWHGIVAAPVIGRTAMVLVVAMTPTRGDGSTADAFRGVRLVPLATGATVLAAVAAWFFAGRYGLVALGLAVVATAAYSWWWRRSFGGLTGDGAGAAGFAMETLALCALTAGALAADPV